jgi:hypothetical protein
MALSMREEILSSRFRIAVSLAGAFAGLLALHLVLALRLPGPILYEDSLGYLAIARHLAGWGPRPLLSCPGFYHFGYSLLLAPLYPLLGSSWRVFRAALVLDSALASLQVIVLYALARGLFGLRRSLSGLAALAAALYPAWLLQSSFAWTESLFALAFSGYVLLAFQAVRRGKAGWLAAFAFAGAFLYTIHPRGIGIVAVTVLFLLAWGARGRFGRGATALSVLVVLGTVAATRQLNHVILTSLWAAPPSAGERVFLGRLLDPAVWTGVLPLRAAGQLWYLLAATLGVFALGTWELGRRAVRRPDGEEAAGTEAARVVLLAMAAVLAASITVMIPAQRSDHFLYGRYNEALLGPFLLAGIALLATGPRRSVLAGWAGTMAVCALLGAALTRLLPAAGLAQPPMVLNVLGVLVWNPPDYLGLLRSSLGAVVAAGVLALLALVSRRTAVLGLAAFFAVSAVAVEQRLLLPFCRYWRGIVTLQDTLRPLAPAAVAYERSGVPGVYGFNAYQFWLDRVRFRLFDAAAGEEPAEPLVIASRSWRLPGYRKMAAETVIDQALWVAPGPLQAELERRGLLVPEASSAPLPPESTRSRIERLDGSGRIVARPGEALRLRFLVRHAGRGAAWVPFALADSPWGSVRLAARWFRAAAALPVEPGGFRGELPRVLRPGESAEVEITVPARGGEGRPLDPGRYELEIGPVQEGIAWFVDTGDRPLRIAVEIRR